MIKEYFESFSGNIVRRFTNPFLGTFVVILLFKNWEAIYTVFTINKNTSLSERIDEIKAAVVTNSIGDLLQIVLITFGFLTVTYLLLWISSVLTTFYTKIAVPWISKTIDPFQIIDRDLFNRLKKEVKILNEKNENLDTENIRHRSDIDELRQTLESKNKELSSLRADLKAEKKEVESIQDDYNNMVKRLEETRNLIDENTAYIDFSFEDVYSAVNSLKRLGLTKGYIELFNEKNKLKEFGYSLSEIERKVISASRKNSLIKSGEDFLWFTKLGEFVYSYLMIENPNFD